MITIKTSGHTEISTTYVKATETSSSNSSTTPHVNTTETSGLNDNTTTDNMTTETSSASVTTTTDVNLTKTSNINASPSNIQSTQPSTNEIHSATTGETFPTETSISNIFNDELSTTTGIVTTGMMQSIMF